MALEWDDLRYVLALTQHQTASAAARALGVSHTTVSRRIRALEEALATRLFDVVDGVSVPTPAGQLVVEAAERTASELHALEAQVLGGDARLAGPLRVTTMDLLFQRYQRAFASFVERYPDVQLSVAIADDAASLTRREADVALRLTNRPPEDLVGRKVGRVDFAVYAARSLADRIGCGAPLSSWPWLSSSTDGWLDTWLKEHAPGARVAMHVDMGTLALRQAISSGIGVHFYADVEGDAEADWVRVGVQPGFSRNVWLLTLPGLRTNSRVRAFLDHIAASSSA